MKLAEAIIAERIKSTQEVIESLRLEFDRANDTNDVNAQVKIAMTITELNITLKNLNLSLKWLQENLK